MKKWSQTQEVQRKTSELWYNPMNHLEKFNSWQKRICSKFLFCRLLTVLVEIRAFVETVVNFTWPLVTPQKWQKFWDCNILVNVFGTCWCVFEPNMRWIRHKKYIKYSSFTTILDFWRKVLYSRPQWKLRHFFMFFQKMWIWAAWAWISVCYYGKW